MAESPYRSAYRIEDHVRAPTHEELALIDERRARDRAVLLRNETGESYRILIGAALGFVGVIACVLLGKPGMAIGLGIIVAVLGIPSAIGLRLGLRRVAAHRGRWDAPDQEWRTHETRIRARSVVHAASEDEDYVTWILFEIPGGEWAAIDDLWLPAEPGSTRATEDLVITWLEPAMECIRVEAHGAPLPRHGALRLGEPGYEGEDFAQAIEDGFGWGDPEAYEEGIPTGEDPIRRVPEDQLAPWMLEAVGR